MLKENFPLYSDIPLHMATFLMGFHPDLAWRLVLLWWWFSLWSPIEPQDKVIVLRWLLGYERFAVRGLTDIPSLFHINPVLNIDNSFQFLLAW